MYKVDDKKWRQFSAEVQLKNIAAEISRASSAELYNTASKKEQSVNAYERALILIDTSLKDPQWKDKNFLYQLRDAVSALYSKETSPSIGRLLSNQLLEKRI
jgi:hypothetical protein